MCFRVFGASMFPWIRSGDLVFARRFGYEQASPGDVILFERNDRLFVHRVLRRAADGSSLITKAAMRWIGKTRPFPIQSFWAA